MQSMLDNSTFDIEGIISSFKKNLDSYILSSEITDYKATFYLTGTKKITAVKLLSVKDLMDKLDYQISTSEYDNKRAYFFEIYKKKNIFREEFPILDTVKQRMEYLKNNCVSMFKGRFVQMLNTGLSFSLYIKEYMTRDEIMKLIKISRCSRFSFDLRRVDYHENAIVFYCRMNR